MSLNAIIEAYLGGIGQLDEQELGGSPNTVSAEYQQSLVASLSGQWKFNKGIIVVAISVLCAIFLLGIFLVIYYRDSPTAIAAILGGNFFSLLVIVGWLRRLWLENSTMGALLAIVEGMTPREAAKVITTWHFRAIKERKHM